MMQHPPQRPSVPHTPMPLLVCPALPAMPCHALQFIAAAGNSGSTTPSYPAAYASPAVISVAAIQSDGNLLPSSNRGSPLVTPWVHLGAPGANIPTTSVPTATSTSTNNYVSNSGTSMAAPHVTGAAALYKAYYPYANHTEIRNAILGSVTPTTSLQNGITSTGGRLNAAAMLQVAPDAACTWMCDAGFYCVTNYCDGCPLTCASCTNPSLCTACFAGWTGATCSIKCLPNCAVCPNSTACTTCLPGWTGATCSTKMCGSIVCTDKQYCQTTPLPAKCISCPTTCTTCTTSSSTSCKPCTSTCGSSTWTCRATLQTCTTGSQCCSGKCLIGKCAT